MEPIWWTRMHLCVFFLFNICLFIAQTYNTQWNVHVLIVMLELLCLIVLLLYICVCCRMCSPSVWEICPLEPQYWSKWRSSLNWLWEQAPSSSLCQAVWLHGSKAQHWTREPRYYRNLELSPFILTNLLHNWIQKATILFKTNWFVLQTTVEKVCVNELLSERWELDLSCIVLCLLINYIYPLIYLSFLLENFLCACLLRCLIRFLIWTALMKSKSRCDLVVHIIMLLLLQVYVLRIRINLYALAW